MGAFERLDISRLIDAAGVNVRFVGVNVCNAVFRFSVIGTVRHCHE